MLTFLLRRFVILLGTLLLVSILAFLIPYVNGGDPVEAILRAQTGNEALDPESLAALREKLGLDRAIHVQYLEWLGRVMQGDFGLSYMTRTPVFAMFANGLTVSITLALSALTVAMLVGIPLGTVAAAHPGSTLDSGVTLFVQTLIATPEYWLGPLAVLVFAIHLGWLPSAGWDSYQSMILPTLVLSMRPIAYFTQVTRAAMAEVFNAPYMTAARARGLSRFQAYLRHGLRNGFLPVMTLFTLWLTSLLGGSIVVEVIFAVPGMGFLLFEAVLNNDVPLIQGAIILIVAVAVTINTITDISYSFVNPTVRVAGGN